VDAINALNTPYFGSNNLGLAPGTPSTFGFASAPVRQPPRDIQLGGRFTF